MRKAAFLVFVLPGVLRAQDPGPILDRASAAYQTVATLAADFVQIVANPMAGGPDTTRGRLYEMRPSRFAMRFTDPTGDRIVADGRWLWLFTPSTAPDQVIRQEIPKGGAVTPNFFAQFLDRPLERYKATLMGKDSVGSTTVDVVKLIPKFNDQPFREAVIAIGRKDGLLRRVALTEETGQKRLIVLPMPQAGVAIAPEEFRFRTPKGVKVVTP